MKIFSAKYLLPISAPPIEGGAIAFEEDLIAAVGPLADVIARFPDADREDFGEAAIMPGLVNVHSHLELTSMRGFADEFDHDFHSWLIKITTTRGERLDERDLELAAIAGAFEGARAGVTCFADIGRLGSAGFKALTANGLRGIVYQETEFSPDDRTAADDFVILRNRFEALRARETTLVRAGISPHAPYTVSASLFESITDYSLRDEVKLTIHAAESVMEEDLMLYGTGFFAGVYEKFGFEFRNPASSTIAYFEKIGVLRAKPLLAHCVRVSDADIDLIADSDSRVAHCPKSNAKFGHGAAPFEKFLERGVRTGLGSDSMASNNVCDLFEEARFATLLARTADESNRFVQPREMIETATIGGARALGLEDEIGSLEAGKQADLIVVALDNVAQLPIHDINSALVFATNSRDVLLTVVAGEEIVRNGKSLKVDQSEIRKTLAGIGLKMPRED
ncbi:MAG: amidohydrolase family protein [Acidobacteria bacterium]|nr:amidohydrolase family protein [Acidobacteriota bacterium]